MKERLPGPYLKQEMDPLGFRTLDEYEDFLNSPTDPEVLDRWESALPEPETEIEEDEDGEEYEDETEDQHTPVTE